ncbi:hypothetical protein ZHAS_00004434 [Anopheles sinensis]|uniref:Uncharacterized protein n=1 Tax=Anopheles sinensis TaxID=74873 RepID=A0A084VGV2_ANOSI|nr:hypothetical protein ZHAS_00004434 [Anopheles sinensis]
MCWAERLAMVVRPFRRYETTRLPVPALTGSVNDRAAAVRAENETKSQIAEGGAVSLTVRTLLIR